MATTTKKKEVKKESTTIFDVLNEMHIQKLDLRAFTKNFVGAEIKGKKGNKYGVMQIGIDEETAQDIMKSYFHRENNFYIVAFVVNAQEYEAINKKISK